MLYRFGRMVSTFRNSRAELRRTCGTESVSWTDLSLDRRIRFRYQLYPLPADTALVVGGVLDHPGIRGVDRGACRAGDDLRAARVADAGAGLQPVSAQYAAGVFVWRAVGGGWDYVRAGDPVPGHCAGVRDCAGAVCVLRDPGAAVRASRSAAEPAGDCGDVACEVGQGDPAGGGGVCAGRGGERRGRLLEGAGADAGGAGRSRGTRLQLREGHPDRNPRGLHELVLCVRTLGGETAG